MQFNKLETHDKDNQKMVSCRISPNVVTYGILVNGLCKMGNAGMVLGLLRETEMNSCSLVGLIQK